MSCETSLRVPQGMKPEEVAQTFSAYLLGLLVYRAGFLDDPCHYGPFPKYGQTNSWQLDTSNDYWLRVEGDVFRVGCRYERQKKMVDLMVELFRERYLNKGVAHAAKV